MSYYPTVRHAYCAPSNYTCGGGTLHGMNSRLYNGASPQWASKAENLYRKDGCVCKRPGFKPIKVYDISGQIIWETVFKGHTLLLYQKQQQYFLQKTDDIGCYTRNVGSQLPQKISMNGSLYILCRNEWIIIKNDGSIISLTSGGTAELNDVSSWIQDNIYQWNFDDDLVPIPLIHAASSPMGKGQPVQTPNLLTPLVSESFLYSKEDQAVKRNRFCLSLQPDVIGNLPSGDNLSDEEKIIRIQTLTNNAKLEIRTESTDEHGNLVYIWQTRKWTAEDNINSKASAFWIQTIHQDALAFDGDDNIRITYYRNRIKTSDEADILMQCRLHTVFGVNGFKDRLFLSGNEQRPGIVWYSEMDRPLYFGSLQFISLGCTAHIRMLSGQAEEMIVVSDQGAFQIAGKVSSEDNGYALDAVFTVNSIVPSPSPAGLQYPVIAGNELLYYTDMGVCTVAPSGVMDERCVQVRSRMLDNVLHAEENSEKCFLFCFQDYVFISNRNDKLFLLDLQRPVQTADDIYSKINYEAYVWNSIPAVEMAVVADRLCFYYNNVLYGFFDELAHDEIYFENSLQHKEINAIWQTVPITGKGCHTCNRFYKITIQVAGRTAVRISYLAPDGNWTVVRDYDGAFGQFRYDSVLYGQWNYSPTEPKSIASFSLPFSHMRKLELRLQNDVNNQDFRMKEFIIHYK